MRKYAVYLTEILSKRIVIDAESKEEACENVEKLYLNENLDISRKINHSEYNIELDEMSFSEQSDFISVSFEELQDDDLVVYKKSDDVFKIIKSNIKNIYLMVNSDYSHMITLVYDFYQQEKEYLKFYRKVK